MSELHRPFSPVIMETMAEPDLLAALNDSANASLLDGKRYREADYSDQLVGKVSHELEVLVADEVVRNKVAADIRELGAEYLNNLISLGIGHAWNRVNGDLTPMAHGLSLVSAWIVSQFKGEYNPCHNHSGCISGIIYTSLPREYQAELDQEERTHFPANGHIEFIFGEHDLLRANSIKFRPEVGKVFLFPSSLRHFAYPFYCDGERRSVSFNLEIIPMEDTNV